VLCAGFADESALFRHEIAFVLGQMMNRHAMASLKKVVENTREHCMVRHEAAEALGAIAEEEARPFLEKFVKDDEQVVAESCEVALDMVEYWNNDEIDNVDDVEVEE